VNYRVRYGSQELKRLFTFLAEQGRKPRTRAQDIAASIQLLQQFPFTCKAVSRKCVPAG
jgi:hypothetical protein